MRHHRLAWLVAAAALTTAPFSIAPASAAAPAPARAVAPADVATPTVVKHVVTDVDGDGTRDTVTLAYLGADQFELAVTTTTKKTSKVAFTSVVDPDRAPAGSIWYGASAMDGRKGSELIVRLNTAESILGVTSTTLGVYTWRSGSLVGESAPATPKGTAWQVNDQMFTEARGFTFFSKGGHRYVDASRLTTNTTKPWKGKITRSVWRNGKWVKVSTRTATPVKGLTKWGQVGIAGPKLLLHAVKVDVNGGGKLDLVRVYQDARINHYLVKVNTGKVARTATYSTDGGSGFVGAAAIDGNAGADLIFQTEAETPLWKVFTWRGGKLASLRGPEVHAGSVGVWAGAGDERATNFTTSIDAGKHYVTKTWIADQSNIAHVKKWVWASGSWTVVSDWTDVTLTADQISAFHKGFTAGDLVTP